MTVDAREIACPACGGACPDDARFCMRCGAALRPRGRQRPAQSESESVLDGARRIFEEDVRTVKASISKLGPVIPASASGRGEVGARPSWLRLTVFAFGCIATLYGLGTCWEMLQEAYNPSFAVAVAEVAGYSPWPRFWFGAVVLVIGVVVVLKSWPWGRAKT